MMVEPLWIAVPKAIRRFNLYHSLPRVWISTLFTVLGLSKLRLQSSKVLVLTCSISQDYARVWYHFAQKYLPRDHFEFLIVDSSGDFDPTLFSGCNLLRFANFYHGKKIDFLINRYLMSDLIFLCDDDKYPVSNISYLLDQFADPKVAAISLNPRSWYRFRIGEQDYLPMGSYSLIFRRSIFLKHNLRFRPYKARSPYKVFPPTVKPQPSYDTADFANEKLLLLGYKIITFDDKEFVIGFDGLSAPRILLMKRGKDYTKKALLNARHFKEGSINGAVLRALYGIVKFEKLYIAIFNEPPKFLSGFSEEELVEIVEKHPELGELDKQNLLNYFHRLESIYRRLVEYAF